MDIYMNFMTQIKAKIHLKILQYIIHIFIEQTSDDRITEWNGLIEVLLCSITGQI